MKKIMTVLLCGALVSCLCLAGCGGSKSSSSQASSSSMTTEHLYYMTYSVPNDWGKKDSSDPMVNQYEPPVGGMLMMSLTGDTIFPSDTDSWIKAYVGELEAGGTTRVGDLSKASLGSAVTYEAPITRTDPNATFKGYTKFILSGYALYWGIVAVPESTLDSYDGTMKTILDSMKLDTTSAPMGEEAQNSSAGASSSASTQSAATVSQQNALKKAKSYLNSGAFSYTGLIEQLQYNSFSVEDATYAADNCGADWNAQAKKKATSYLSSGAFSYTGLIEQLEFNGFTAEQATYGADNCGGDWNAQAAKKAESYMKSGSFSRDGLIGQLEFNGFTEEQAIHGVDSVGL